MGPKVFQRYKITIQYDGTDYEGWQVQPGKSTIQRELQRVYGKLFNRPTKVTGSGRTDSGVHAWAQVAHFDAPEDFHEQSILRGANSQLPRNIRIIKVEKADPAFHARTWAKEKTYRYVIEEAPVPSALYCRYTMHYFSRLDLPAGHIERIRFPKLDLTAMKEASEIFLGEMDFLSFQASGAATKTSIRKITAVEWIEESLPLTKGRLITFQVTGSGFLKQMVRNMVGTLLLVGQRKLKPIEMIRIIETLDRKVAGPTAPGKGLALQSVKY